MPWKTEILHIILYSTQRTLSNSYTMVCPSGHGDNPHAKVCGLSPRTGRQPWLNFYTISV